MSKRTRDDFDDYSDSESLPSTEARTVTHFSSTQPSSSKILHLDPDSPGDSGEVTPAFEMKCSLPPHKETLSFPSHEAFEIHYNKTHLNRCLECRRNFPTERFLNLHIEENHDALVAVRKERGEKTYACFVEDCDRVCSTWEKRRQHLIDKHVFPREYDYAVVNKGIDNRSSMLISKGHRRRSSAAQYKVENDKRNSTLGTINSAPDQTKSESAAAAAANVDTPPQTPRDAAMDQLTGAMSSLKFVPPSVRFGRGRGRARGGFSRT